MTKMPSRFNQHERYLDVFVNAAQTKAMLAACDVLFIHGNDLTWGEARQGFFLIDVDEDLEEVIQLVEARVKTGFSRVLKPIISTFQSIMMEPISEVAAQIAQQPATDEKEVIGAYMAGT